MPRSVNNSVDSVSHSNMCTIIENGILSAECYTRSSCFNNPRFVHCFRSFWWRRSGWRAEATRAGTRRRHALSNSYHRHIVRCH